MKKRYLQTSFVNKIVKYSYDGTEESENNSECCEVIKHSFHKSKTIELWRVSSKINYTVDEINRWINSLKELKFKFEYIIEDCYHKIRIHTFDYATINEAYLTVLLVRYLWYEHNDGLIDRIWNIQENSDLNFEQSLILAQNYDYTNRNPTFNLSYDGCLFSPKSLTDGISKSYINSINNNYLSSTLGTFYERVEECIILKRLLIIICRLALDEFLKVYKDLSYNHAFDYINNLVAKLKDITYSRVVTYNQAIPMLTKAFTVIYKKNLDVTVESNLIVGELYIVLPNSNYWNLNEANLYKYIGLKYPNDSKYDKYKLFEREGKLTTLQIYPEDTLLYKINFK